MALPDADRWRVWVAVMRWWSQQWDTLGNFNDTQLRSALNATDDWIEANQGSYNAALPQPFRGEATDAQKTLLFCAVAIARVNISFLRRVFGEVD